MSDLKKTIEELAKATDKAKVTFSFIDPVEGMENYFRNLHSYVEHLDEVPDSKKASMQQDLVAFLTLVEHQQNVNDKANAVIKASKNEKMV